MKDEDLLPNSCEYLLACRRSVATNSVWTGKLFGNIRESVQEYEGTIRHMRKEYVGYRNIAAVISIFLLLLAIPRLPYGYYIFLRWALSATALFSAWAAYECKCKFWVFVMGGIAILFNPIIPVHLPKETWIVIDFIIAVIFLVSIFCIKLEKKPREVVEENPNETDIQ